MPEAAMYKNGYSVPWKADIRLSRQVAPMQTEAKSQPM
jgi:hypothetical protein